MFSGLAAIEHHPARRWTATASFMLQSALVMGAFIYPLLHISVLPETLLRPRIFVPVSNGEVRPETATTDHPSGPPQVLHPIIVSPSKNNRISTSQTSGVGFPSAPPIGDVIPGSPTSPITSILSANTRPVPHPAASAGPVVRKSAVLEGLLIHRVQPQYPVIAKQLHIQGAVVVDALIGRDGRIEQATVIRGQALLNRSAVEAIKQWQYRPYYLNGEPVEVETEITVNFVMEH
jgi:periplasmic protein TonB